jgi:hypothetical protein
MYKLLWLTSRNWVFLQTTMYSATSEFRWNSWDPRVHRRIHNKQSLAHNIRMLDKSSSHNPILFPLNHSIQVCFSPLRTQASSLFRFRDHTQDTPPSVVLLRTSNKPDAGTTTWQHTKLIETDIHAPSGIRTRNLSERAVAKPTP